MLALGIILALASVLLWSISGTIEKEVAKRLRTSTAAVLVAAFGAISILSMYLPSATAQSQYVMLLSITSGIFWAVGALLFYKSLETEQVSNAIGLTLIQAVVIAIFAVLVLGESLNGTEISGGFIMIIGILLLSTNMNKFTLNRKLLPALFGNISFAAYWILLSSAIVASGQQIALPIIISRAASSLFAILVFVLFAEHIITKAKPKHKAIPKSKRGIFTIKALLALGAIAGLIDGLGNGLYAIVVTLGQLAIAGIIISLGPLITTLFARIAYREKLNAVQGLGIIIAVAGAVMLSIG